MCVFWLNLKCLTQPIGIFVGVSYFHGEIKV